MAAGGTHRGLEGRARAHKAAGGRAYGHVSATESKTEDREMVASATAGDPTRGVGILNNELYIG